MPSSIQPELKPKLSRKAEVKDFYKGLSKYSQREVNVSSIHKRHESLIEKVVTLWSGDKGEISNPTGFQTRMIELHNNRKKITADPENSTRLLAFLTVFGETNYSDAEINTLTQGTFERQDQVDDFLNEAFNSDKKWRLEYGKISLKREGDPIELANLTREELAKEQLVFRAAMIPHSQFSGLGLYHRLHTHLATEYKIIGISNKFKQRIERIESSGLAKFDLTNAQELLKFIEEGSSANIKAVLGKEAKEKVSRSDMVKSAEEKGFKNIAAAADEENLDRLRSGGVKRHQEIVTNFNSVEDFYKWIYKDLNLNDASKFEAVLAVARNDKRIFDRLVTEFNLPAETSITTILEKIDGMETGDLQTAADNIVTEAINRLKDAPWNIKIDVAHDLLARRLEQINSEDLPLPEIKIENLDLTDKDVTYKHAATLLIQGFTEIQLIKQGMTLEKIEKGIKTYIKTDEDGKIVRDANGKPESKTVVEKADEKRELRDLKTPTPAQLAEAKSEIETSLKDNNDEVNKAFKRIAKNKSGESREAAYLEGTTTLNLEMNRAIAYAEIKSKKEFDNLWDTNNNEPNNTHTDYQANLERARQLALNSQPLKDEINEKAQEKAQAAIDQYEREHVTKSELVELGAIQLSGLVKEGKIDKNSDLPDAVKTEVETILNGPGDNIDPDRLKNYITTNADKISGIDLAILFTIIDTLPQALANNLSETEQEKFRQMGA